MTFHAHATPGLPMTTDTTGPLPDDVILLSELLAARLCHDITGPIGAINNGIELLSEDDEEMRDAALDLMRSSADEAIGRLTFYRMAYGVAKGGQSVSGNALREWVDRFLHAVPVTVDWSQWPLDTVMPVAEGRLLMNLLLLASGSLLRGGEVHLRLLPAGGWHCRAEGKAVRLDPELVKILQNGADIGELTPRLVQCFLTWRLACQLGCALHVEVAENQLLLTVE